jgi:hypothetical protein
LNNYGVLECSTKTFYSRLALSSSKNGIVDEHVFIDVAVVSPKLFNNKRLRRKIQVWLKTTEKYKLKIGLRRFKKDPATSENYFF